MFRLVSSRMIVALFVVAVAGAAALRPVMSAQDNQANLNAADVMRLTLNEQVGKRVRLKLASGQDLEGQVARVGSHGVALTALTGQEFFNATVSLAEVAAVIVRAPGK
jgi:hypothetical protein